MYGISRLFIATVALVGMFAVLLLYGANENQRMAQYDANFTAREIEVGADLYFQGCTQCHGQHGEGLVGPALNAADLLVPDLGQTKPPRLIQKNYVGDLRSYIEGAITYGRVGTVMPAWGQAAGGPFRGDQVRALTTFIMNWGKNPGQKWGGVADRVAVGGVEPVGVASQPLVAAPPRDQRSVCLGKYMFDGPASCAECHAFNGAVGVTGPELTGVVASKGREYVVDSIVNPAKAAAAGHAPDIMPQTFDFSLTDIEIQSIVDYLEKPQEAVDCAPTPAPAQLDGQQLAQNNGCTACHSVDGSRIVGPTWKGLFGQTNQLVDGTSVTVDEAYLRDAIVDPNKQIVKTDPPYAPNLMPATFGNTLSEEQITAIIEYIKTLK